jgi:predicted membrane-bound mannosyltransferase
MLGFLHGMILLAGIGAVVLVRMASKGLPRLIVVLILFAASVHLAWQAYLSNYKFYDDSRNPYVYAHTTSEVFEVVRKVEEYAGVYKDGHDMPIQVICPDYDYWPLPWYLRSFSNVTWWDKVVNNVPSAPLIICSDKVEAALADKLYTLTPPEERQMYMYLFVKPYYVWLRPQVKLLGFISKDLWDNLQQQRARAIPTSTEAER